MPLRTLASLAIAASMLGTGAAVACPDPGESSTAFPTRDGDSWSRSMRTVSIDGREFRVTFSAWLISVNSSGAVATAGLTVESLDGKPLPGGLSAASIRMQRVNAPTRIVQRNLVQTDPVIEPDAGVANFGLERNFKASPAGGRFKTTVRLTLDGRTIAVPMGTIRVNTYSLVSTDPVTGPDLTPNL